MDTAPTAIAWPDWWVHREWRIGFLVGMPFVGPHVRMLQMVRDELQRRESSCLSVWGKDPLTREIVAKTSKVISGRIGWPNAWFIPADTLDLLLGNFPGLQLDDEARVLRAACIACGVRLSVIPETSLCDQNTTFGDLVSAIREAKGPKPGLGNRT